MTDPQTVVGAAAFVAAVIVAVIVKLRTPANADDVREAVRQEFVPILKIVDRTEHEIAVLHKEIAHAITHSEITATRLTELEGAVEKRIGDMGEAFDRRADELEQSMKRIIADTTDSR